jgi:hypothetical protein
VGCAVVDGVPVAVSGDQGEGDGEVRVWDLRNSTERTSILFPEPIQAIAATTSGDVVVGFAREVAVLQLR